MRAAAVLLAGLSLAILGGCARRFVVEREGGRVDSARSISTYGDTAWTIRHEPEAAPSDEDR
jgi:hypothetical protein